MVTVVLWHTQTECSKYFLGLCILRENFGSDRTTEVTGCVMAVVLVLYREKEAQYCVYIGGVTLA